MKAIVIVVMVLITGCDLTTPGDYTCTDEQMQKAQRECEYQIKLGFDPVFAFKQSVQRNCEPKESQ